MTDDELRDRLHRADPARHQTPADSWLDDLVEATMSSPETTAKRRWLPLAAAAAVLAVVGGGVSVALSGGDEDSVTAKPAVVTMKLPAGDTMSSCIQFSVDVLRDMDQAFSATASEVEDNRVRLDVDHWYKGGDANQVVLETPDATAVALIGSVEYEQGGRYLITATAGTVNSCGFSAPWSQEMADAFDEAF